MTYLLDTAVWANSVLMPAVLPERIRALLRRQEDRALASISLLETAILHRLGRMPLAAALAEFYRAGLAQNVKVLEMSPDIASETNDLGDGFQGDPFDRAIVATARVHHLVLITADRKIRDSAACQVEFYPFRPSRLKP